MTKCVRRSEVLKSPRMQFTEGQVAIRSRTAFICYAYLKVNFVSTIFLFGSKRVKDFMLWQVFLPKVVYFLSTSLKSSWMDNEPGWVFEPQAKLTFRNRRSLVVGKQAFCKVEAYTQDHAISGDGWCTYCLKGFVSIWTFFLFIFFFIY